MRICIIQFLFQVEYPNEIIVEEAWTSKCTRLLQETGGKSMKKRRVDRSSLIVTLCVMIAFCLCGCVSRVEFDTTEEVLDYLKETFPGKHIHISDGFSDNFRGNRRTWKFTMNEYPDKTFTVASEMARNFYSFYPSLTYTHTALSNNVYSIIQEGFISDFEKSIDDVYGERAKGVWKGLKSRNAFYGGGFEQEIYAVPVVINIETYSDLQVVQQLMDGMLDALHEKEFEISDFGFSLNMQIENYTEIQGSYRHLFDINIDGEVTSLLFKSYSHSVQLDYYPSESSTTAVIDDFKDNIIGYYVLTAENGNGVTDEIKQAWLLGRIKEQKEAKVGNKGIIAFTGYNWQEAYVGYDTLHYLLGRMYTEDTTNVSKGFYLTSAEAMEFYRQCGLTVSGNHEVYRVKGTNGSIYEFHKDWPSSQDRYHYKKDGEPMQYSYNTEFIMPYTIHQSLVEEISGVDITDYLAPVV